MTFCPFRCQFLESRFNQSILLLHGSGCVRAAVSAKAVAPRGYSVITLCKGAEQSLDMVPQCGADHGRNIMLNTNPVPISELSDTELDSVAAGTGWAHSFKQVAVGNVAAQLAANNQANLAVVNILSGQGGVQSNNNNAGNQA